MEEHCVVGRLGTFDYCFWLSAISRLHLISNCHRLATTQLQMSLSLFKAPLNINDSVFTFYNVTFFLVKLNICGVYKADLNQILHI